MVTDLDLTNRARDYVDQIPWRLESVQRRCRYDGGTVVSLPVRVRRFVNGVPAGMVFAVCAEIESRAPYSGVVFNGDDEGVRYVPVGGISIRKDGSLKVGSDETYTIVQDLKPDDGAEDSLSFVDSSACSAVVASEYRWDESSVPDCESGSQGVTYQISDVSRDNDTNLFSYRIRETRAVTQHSPQKVTAATDNTTTTVETWDNVYGEPGSFRWDSVVHAGSLISTDISPNPVVPTIPNPDDRLQNMVVEVDVDHNSDCTYKVRVKRTVSRVEPWFEYSAYRDSYSVELSDLTENAASGLTKTGTECGVDRSGNPSPGTTLKYESKMNEDGSWNNRITEKREREVSSSQVSVTVRPRYTVTERTDTNVQSRASGLPSGSSYGSYEYQKTPGGLYVNKYRTYSPALVAAGYSCEDTAFIHTHSVTSTLSDFPGDPSSLHVSEAGGGVVRQVSARRDEETGIVIREEGVKSEHTVEYATRGVTRTLFGTNEEYQHRSRRSVPDLVLPDGALGSVSYKVTDGKLYDVSGNFFTKSPPGTVLGSDCSKTVFEHRHTVSQTASEVGDHVSDAGGGTTREASYTVDPQTGAVKKVETVVSEVPAESAQESKKKTLRGVIVTRTDRNVEKGDLTVSKVGDQVEVTETPGGKWTRTVTSVDPVSVGTVSTSCSVSSNVHTDSKTVNQASEPGESHGTAVVNREVVKTSKQTDVGTWDVETKTTTYTKAVATSEVKWATETVKTTVSRHDSDKDKSVSGSFGETSSQPDDNGAASTTVSEYTPIPVDSGWIKWDSTTKTPNGTYKYHHGARIFKNLSSVPSVTSGSNVQIDVSINKFGLYDGKVAYSDLYDWTENGSGSSGGSQTGTFRFVQTMQDASGLRWSRTCTVNVRTFYGKGNEGAEAACAASSYSVPGVSLPSRTYATDAPIPGMWYTDV